MKKFGLYIMAAVLLLGIAAFPIAAQENVVPEEELPVIEPLPEGPETIGPVLPEVPQLETLPEISEEESPISLELKSVDISDALRILFASTEPRLSFSLDPRVKGPVTVSLNNVSFGAALRAVLDQARATYRKEGNLYYIVPMEAPGLGPTEQLFAVPQAPMRLKVMELRFSDAAEIAYLFGGTSSGATGAFGSFMGGGGARGGGGATRGLTAGGRGGAGGVGRR